MNFINIRHSIIFFNLCIFISPIYYLIKIEPIILCLFLILIIGISHGSLDNLKGQKLLKILGFKSIYLFYLVYLTISFLIILLWLFSPNVTLLLFLIIAAYHFGKEDTIFKLKKDSFIIEVVFFFKGSTIIIAPLLMNRDATNEIFNTLNFNVFENSFFNDFNLIVFLILSFLSNMYLSLNKKVEFKAVLVMDFFAVIILNFFLTPVLAFTIYFCFLHSVRHSITLVFELSNSFRIGVKKFIYKAIPLTLITAIFFLMTIYFLNNFYRLDEAIYKVIFIGLASLTFPHILLEYFLEKNEKGT